MRSFLLTSMIASLSLLFASCQKEAESSSEVSQGSRLKMIRSKWYDSIGYRRFQYDNSDRLIAVLDSNNNGNKYKVYVNYDGQGRISKVTMASNGTWDGSFIENNYVFEYNNLGQIIKRLRIQPGQQAPHVENTYSYDSQGRLIADSIYSYWTDTIFSIVSFSYGSNKNVIESKVTNMAYAYLGFQVQRNYDSHPNPIGGLGIMTYLYSTEYDIPFGENNLVKEKYHDGTVVDYTYEYYNNGLPKKCSFSDNTDPSVTYYDYYYE